MGKVTINKDKCKGCLLCISVCPKGLLVVDENLNKLGANPVRFSPSNATPQKAQEANDECLGCGLCALICPDCCIEVYK